ncbi:sigma-70 family RNA polymerase sigma factor [Streptomyces pseudovenezuelae]|uniref:RNA polymerase sigma factor (Sigma-70 family) n=1 Tax=Streptomyces pseudovenezuelae TaxID=67350 RepID=A0ABT6LQV7_9ACTN|nr:sigma-70 family RNA polymerase sigma factor [Streptomyces pseudovenezuelae]MDH6218638.1 RNA polymerase sigma factor (sigma-70 family) [Streptomyces pseudovenezuelae]
MPKFHRSGPDSGVVTAAGAGDRQALDALVTQSLPLVYNIVGRALNGHADVDDVVQETLLRMVRGLPKLRDPSAFRSWLVAITIRQVRDREQSRATDRDRRAHLEDAEAITDPALDFAGLTILRLGLTEQRREVAEATRWLDTDDQELLSLWWLEETGELERAELAGALGLSDRHAAVRVQRMKKQMEISRVVVRSLTATPRCAELDEMAALWDGTPSALWRKRFARHIRDCRVCEGLDDGLLPMDRLLSGLPLLAVPASLDPSRVLVTVTGGGQSAGSGAGSSSGTGSDGGSSSGSGAPSAHRGVGRGHRGARRGHGRRTGRTAARGVRNQVIGGSAVAVVAVAALVAARMTGGSAAPAAESAPPTPVAVTSPSATPSPSLSKSASPSQSPTRKPKPTPSKHTAAAPVQIASGAKKGVGVWTFNGVSQALGASGASWYYTWNTQHQGVTTPSSTSFVPMIWGADSVTDGALAQARANGPYLLGFNEPDMAQQSNMSVEQALGLWPKLMAAGKTLGSPAVAYGGDTAGGWLDRFMSGAAAKGYRVDFITLHWYGGDFRTPQAVDQLKSYLAAVYARYHKPIWLTEYALIDFSQGTRFPSPQKQADFVTASTKALDGLSYVQRYAWFGLGADPSKPSSGLFTNGTTATVAGRAFQAAR